SCVAGQIVRTHHMHPVARIGVETREVERREIPALARGGSGRAAYSQWLEDLLLEEREKRRVLFRLAHMLRILLRRGLGARVVHPERLEDLLPHEREELLI